MYLLMAYIEGQWAIGGIDPHEHCAVLFIEQIDEQFGEDTAFVVKLPDRGNTQHADNHDRANGASFITELLESLEKGNVNLDEELRKLNQK